jgi:pseudouridine kinase
MADSICFVTGAHIDLTGRLFGIPVLSASNPGRVTARPGGAGLNSASTAARLGAGAVIASPIGSDHNGELLRAALSARGIGDALVTVEHLRTGTYTAIIAPDGSMVIGLADLSIYEAVDADWFMAECGAALGNAGIWFLNANLPATTLSALADRAGGKRLAAATISPAKAPRLAPVLSKVDFLFTNVSEARTLLAMPEAEAETLVAAFIAAGVRSGTISQAAGPLAWWHEGRRGRIVPPPVERIADVNGAGDALAATILAGNLAGIDFERSAMLAVHAAQMTLESEEPWCDTLSWKALEARADAAV